MLENQGAAGFLGEPALDLRDLMATDGGMGRVNVLMSDRLMQSPRLYAMFLLWLLSELFEQLPEVGDPDKPVLVFVFDEAHLLFTDAPKALVDKVVQVVRLIRSKGVGVYFCTQNPDDVPADVLAQLGNRVQHALRAFTPRDAKALKAAAETFRPNPEFDTETAIREVGTGEAVVSLLEEKGVPAMVSRTLIRPPESRLGPVSAAERDETIAASPVAGRYDTAARPRVGARDADGTAPRPPPEEAAHGRGDAGAGAGRAARSCARRGATSRPVAPRAGAEPSLGTELARTVVKQGRQARKLAIRRRPVAWLFSGWNWVPTRLSRATMAVTGPPWSTVGEAVARVVGHEVVGVDEVGVVAGGDAGEERVGREDFERVPAHVRDLERGVGGRDADARRRGSSRSPGCPAVLEAAVAISCWPTQMPRKGAPSRDHPRPRSPRRGRGRRRGRRGSRRRRRRRAGRCGRRGGRRRGRR